MAWTAESQADLSSQAPLADTLEGVRRQKEWHTVGALEGLPALYSSSQLYHLRTYMCHSIPMVVNEVHMNLLATSIATAVVYKVPWIKKSLVHANYVRCQTAYRYNLLKSSRCISY